MKFTKMTFFLFPDTNQTQTEQTKKIKEQKCKNRVKISTLFNNNNKIKKMPSPTKLDWTKIDIEKDFRFSPMPVKGMSHDGFTIYLKIFDRDSEQEIPFIHQSPPLIMPFGIKGREQNGRLSYKIGFSFPSVRYDPTSQNWTGEENYVNYLKFIKGIDDFNKDHVFKNMKNWFPGSKSFSKEVLSEFYFSNLWISEKCRQGEYSPTFSAKLISSAEGIVTNFFSNQLGSDGKPKSIKFEEDENGAWKGLKCIPLLKASSLWFAGRNYGMSFQIIQMMIFFKEQFIGCAIDVDANDLCVATDETDAPVVDPDLVGEENQFKRIRYDEDQGVNTATKSDAPAFNPPPTITAAGN